MPINAVDILSSNQMSCGILTWTSRWSISGGGDAQSLPCLFMSWFPCLLGTCWHLNLVLGVLRALASPSSFYQESWELVTGSRLTEWVTVKHVGFHEALQLRRSCLQSCGFLENTEGGNFLKTWSRDMFLRLDIIITTPPVPVIREPPILLGPLVS